MKLWQDLLYLRHLYRVRRQQYQPDLRKWEFIVQMLISAYFSWRWLREPLKPFSMRYWRWLGQYSELRELMVRAELAFQTQRQPKQERPPTCYHEEMQALVKVARVMSEDDQFGMPRDFYAEVKVVCGDCLTPFHFVGVPAGCSPQQPMTAIDGCELYAPMQPGLEWRANATYVLEQHQDDVGPHNS